MKVINNIGKYIIMMTIVFSKPEKWRIFRIRLFQEIEFIGIKSIPIVALMSTFMGGVIALQTASNMDSPWLHYTFQYHPRIFTNHYFIDFGWKSWFEHRF
jgi:phospholipid/cholesterol/gamma-HCH transport system permease protein